MRNFKNTLVIEIFTTPWEIDLMWISRAIFDYEVNIGNGNNLMPTIYTFLCQ